MGITFEPLDWPFDPEVFIFGHSGLTPVHGKKNEHKSTRK